MSKVFIGGSRHLSRLNADTRNRLDNVISGGLAVVVGDANGADKAVQTYLDKAGYRNVEVFCSGRHCRNNVGRWPVRSVTARVRPGTFEYFAAKDQKMAAEADIGFMIWDGKSKGTLVNAYRLLSRGKKVVIYRSDEQRFWDLKNLRDWHEFAADCSELKRVVEKTAQQEHASSLELDLPSPAR
jgi:hypothetical protein